MAPGVSERRAGRLLRWYPKAWRARYGEEFLELLISDLDERPHSWRRTVDVAGHGLRARVSIAAVPGTQAEPAAHIRAGLITVGCAAGALLTFGIAMWSQVVIGWRWRPPATPAVAAGMIGMSAGVLLLASLTVVAAIPLAVSAGRSLLQGDGWRLVLPAALVGVALAVLIVGGLHFDAHWPGSRGRPWGSHGLVPSGVAAFCWAVTRGVSSYWFHPHELAQFTGAEIGWMACSVASIVALMVGLTVIVRRLPLSPAVLRFEALLARAACAVMALFAAGAGAWVFTGKPVGPTGVYSVGIIDVVGLAVIGVALLTAARAARQIGLATRSATV